MHFALAIQKICRQWDATETIERYRDVEVRRDDLVQLYHGFILYVSGDYQTALKPASHGCSTTPLAR